MGATIPNVIREGGPVMPERIGTGSLVSSWAHWENVGLKGDLSLNDIDLLWPATKAERRSGRTVNGLRMTRAITAVSSEFGVDGVYTITITVRDPLGHLFASGQGRTGRWREKREPVPVDPKTHKKVKNFQRNPVEVDENWDPIMAPNLIAKSAEVNMQGVVFRLVKARPTWSTGEVELTFEHRIMYWLKRKGGPGSKARRFDRRNVTRAQAIQALLREVRAVEYRFVCPRLLEKQAIAQPDPKTKTQTDSSLPAASEMTGDPGKFPRNVSLPIQDAGGSRTKATAWNRRVGATVLAEADRHTGDHKARLALMEAVMVESMVSNPAGGTGSSVGVLQLLSSHLGGSTAKKGGRMDIELCTRLFLTKGFASASKGIGAIGLAKSKEGQSMTSGQIAQACQGSAYADRYDKVKEAAQAWLDAWSGDATGTDGTSTVTQPFQYGRDEDEDNWTAIQRMAEEVGWRFFIVGNSVYYISEKDLYARRPRYVVKPSDPTLIEATFDIDWGKPVSSGELTISNTDRWGTPPGCVVLLEGFGPPDGRWLVKSVSRDWYSPITTLSIQQPGAAKKEPANATNQRAQNADSDGVTGEITAKGGAKGIVDQAFAIAREAGGPTVYVGSDFRPGSTTTSGNVSDHSQNNSGRAARDIGKRGTNLLTGPPSEELDKAVVAIGKAFGRDYGSGKSGPFQNADNIQFKGHRVQIIWRTPKWGGHMGHIHVGARKN